MYKGVAAVLPASTVFRDQVDNEGCKDMGRELRGAPLSLPGAPNENSSSREGAGFE